MYNSRPFFYENLKVVLLIGMSLSKSTFLDFEIQYKFHSALFLDSWYKIWKQGQKRILLSAYSYYRIG